jgi:hypothetical protein
MHSTAASSGGVERQADDIAVLIGEERVSAQFPRLLAGAATA